MSYCLISMIVLKSKEFGHSSTLRDIFSLSQVYNSKEVMWNSLTDKIIVTSQTR